MSAAGGGLRPAALAMACLLAASSAQAQMYKCVDQRGVTRYADRPQPDCPGKEVDIRAQPPISGKLDDYHSDVNAAEGDFQKRRIEREHQEAAQAQAAAAHQQRCERMRAAFQRFITLRRVPAPGPNGERDYLDGATRDATTAQMEAQLKRECG